MLGYNLNGDSVYEGENKTLNSWLKSSIFLQAILEVNIR